MTGNSNSGRRAAVDRDGNRVHPKRIDGRTGTQGRGLFASKRRCQDAVSGDSRVGVDAERLAAEAATRARAQAERDVDRLPAELDGPSAEDHFDDAAAEDIPVAKPHKTRFVHPGVNQALAWVKQNIKVRALPVTLVDL